MSHGQNLVCTANSHHVEKSLCNREYWGPQKWGSFPTNLAGGRGRGAGPLKVTLHI